MAPAVRDLPVLLYSRPGELAGFNPRRAGLLLLRCARSSLNRIANEESGSTDRQSSVAMKTRA